jgi:hypothetical protein
LILMALVCGATPDAAAQKAGVSKATVRRRVQEPSFRDRLKELRSEMVQRAAGMMLAATGEAVKTLLELLKNGGPPPTRLGAARSILEIGIKMRESADFAERLAALEEQVQANKRA